MKRKIFVLILATSLFISGCTDSEESTSEQVTEEIVQEIPKDNVQDVIVGNLLECPKFTADQNTSAMVDQIALTAKAHAENLTDEEASKIIQIIKETDHKFYDGSDKMELFMWYGYLLDYKFDDSDARSQLGTDLCQAIKYVYRDVETVLDDSTQENLSQIDEILDSI